MEEDLKASLVGLTRGTAKLCAELLNVRASSEFIAENLLGNPLEDVEEFINGKMIDNERLLLGIEQLKKLDLDMTYNCNIYFFSSLHGLVTTTPQLMLRKDSMYNGEDIIAGIEQVIPELLLPLLYDSLKNPDLSLSKRINESITHVLRLLDKQKENLK